MDQKSEWFKNDEHRKLKTNGTMLWIWENDFQSRILFLDKKLWEENVQGLKTFTMFLSKGSDWECAPPKQRNNPRDRRDGIQGIYKSDGNKSSGLEERF